MLVGKIAKRLPHAVRHRKRVGPVAAAGRHFHHSAAAVGRVDQLVRERDEHGGRAAFQRREEDVAGAVKFFTSYLNRLLTGC
jgi:hypothetical protein